MIYKRKSSNDLPAPKKDRRNRFQFRFWLDCMKDDELLLAEELDNLKSKRNFQTSIRDALQLILDLRRGSTSVLRTMFPSIVAQIEAEARATVESPANAEFAALLADAITQRLPHSTSVMIETHALPEGKVSDLPSAFVDSGAGEKATASEARSSFAAGFGNLFDENEDDLFD